MRPAIGSETVLVVEDEKEVLALAADQLQELSYTVLTAEKRKGCFGSSRARRQSRRSVSDVIMPGGMNGAQLAVEARRIKPELKIQLTSGYTAAALSREHQLPEDLEVLNKPYGREELANRLRLVISI